MDTWSISLTLLAGSTLLMVASIRYLIIACYAVIEEVVSTRGFVPPTSPQDYDWEEIEYVPAHC